MINKQNKLRRDLGPLSGYATIIGILVGAGIFRVTGEAGAVAGSSVPLAYLLFAPIIILDIFKAQKQINKNILRSNNENRYSKSKTRKGIKPD